MIYFDNAATTMKKPDSVYKAVRDSIKKYSANPGRSGHKLSIKASEAVYEARELIAKHLYYNKPENIVFTYNATYALNMAIKTLIPKNCHVIISNFEHNSVFRPIERLSEDGVLDYSIYNAKADNVFKEIESHIRPDTKAIVTTLASNVTGESISLFALSELKKKYGLTLILDASQAAGHKEFNLGGYEFDAFIAPGHKAFFGIMGCGFCIFNRVPEHTFIEGGSGSESRAYHMPEYLPERMEGGTVALPAIASLCAGVKYLNCIGVRCVEEKLRQLTELTLDRLSSLNGVTVYGANSGVISFNINGMSAEQVARELDKQNVCTRAGLHCAPLAHKSIGTYDIGTVRVSLSYFNYKKEIDAFYKKLKNCKV